MATAATSGAHVELLLAQAGRHLSDEPIQLIVIFTMLDEGTADSTTWRQ